MEIDIFRRVDAGVLGFSQWFRVRYAKSDNQNLVPIILHLLEKPLAFAAAEVEQKNGGGALLQNRLEPLGLADVSHFHDPMEKRTRTPNEIRIFRVENAACG
jgi:hypothetical protein